MKTTDHEHRFQKAVRDIQVRWLDRIFPKPAAKRRCNAAVALADGSHSLAVSLLIDTAKQELASGRQAIIPSVLQSVETTLVKLGKSAVQELLVVATCSEGIVFDWVLKILGEIGPSAAPGLIEMLEVAKDDKRGSVSLAIVRTKTVHIPAVAVVVDLLASKKIDMQMIETPFAEIFSKVEDPTMVPFLKKTLMGIPSQIAYVEYEAEEQFETGGPGDGRIYSVGFTTVEVKKTKPNKAYESLVQKITELDRIRIE